MTSNQVIKLMRLPVAQPGLLALIMGLSLSLTVMAQGPGSQAPAGPEVRLNLIFTDRSNHFVEDARQEEFQVLEGKAPQTISVFQRDERPVNFVVALDASGSFKDLLSYAIDATRMVLDGNREGDETALIRFTSSNRIESLSNFTSDHSALSDKLKLLYVEGGQSAVIDALYVAVQTAADHNAGNPAVRRAVVLISDGEDRASFYDEKDLVKLIQRTQVQVFVIGMVIELDDTSPITRTSPRAAAESLLKRVATESGGRVFFARHPSELGRAAAEIVHDLHMQYALVYQSTNNDRRENFRRVEIKMANAPGHRSLTAIARPGYFINPPEPTAKEKKSKE
jgi:Ca-activated chloride channel family protein